MVNEKSSSPALSLWWVVAAATTLISVTMGIRYTFGLYMPSFIEVSGSGREMFSLAIATQNLMWGMLSPMFGGLADRYGCGRVAIYGVFIYLAGLLLMFFATPLGLFSGQFLIGVGMAGASFSVALGAIGKSAPKEKRSLSLGIAAAGGSFGQFALVPIGDVLAVQFGWALAFAIMAGIAAAVLIPATQVLKKFDVPDHHKGPSVPFRKVLHEAFTNPDYMLLLIGFFVCGFQVVFVSTHLPGYLTDFGLSSSIASWSLSLIGLFNIFGTLACGWLGDHYSKKNTLTGLYLLRSLAFLIFILAPPNPVTTIIFSAVLGLLWLGTVPLTSGLVAHFFGPTYMAMLYGVVFFSHQAGSFMGAWLGGLIYDYTDSYDLMWWLTIALGVLAAILHYPIRESKYAMT